MTNVQNDHSISLSWKKLSFTRTVGEAQWIQVFESGAVDARGIADVDQQVPAVADEPGDAAAAVERVEEQLDEARRHRVQHRVEGGVVEERQVVVRQVNVGRRVIVWTGPHREKSNGSFGPFLDHENTKLCINFFDFPLENWYQNYRIRSLRWSFLSVKRLPSLEL